MKFEKVTRRAQEQFQMVLEEKSRYSLLLLCSFSIFWNVFASSVFPVVLLIPLFSMFIPMKKLTVFIKPVIQYA